MKSHDRAEEVLRSALGGSSLSDLLSKVPQTHTPCRAIDGADCPNTAEDLRRDEGGAVMAAGVSQGRDLYWHDFYASLDSEETWSEYLKGLRSSAADGKEDATSEHTQRRLLLADLAETDLAQRPEGIRDKPESKSWILNYKEPSGFGGESGRLTDEEYSVVTESIRSIAERKVSTASGGLTADHGTYTHSGINQGAGMDRSNTAEEDSLISSMHYFPAARRVDAHRLSLLPNTGMQVLHELIHIWREEEGEYYSRPAGAWPGAATQIGEPGSAQRQAEDDFFQEYAGEKKEDRYQRKLVEAENGNVHSQMWLGKKIFSDNNGNDRIVAKARVWFEKAAAQVHPEANYIMGVLSMNSLGGLKRDVNKEIHHFLIAAYYPEPFPMAYHALGDLHNNLHRKLNGESNDNVTLSEALEYYSKAAEYDFHESHFQIALIYKAGGDSIPVDIPKTVVHLTLAASLGSTKALSYLAHAFFDQNSWIVKYSREILAERLDQRTHSYEYTVPMESRTSREPSEISYAAFIYEFFSSGAVTSLFEGTWVEIAARVRDQLFRLGSFLFQDLIGPDPPAPSRFLTQHIQHDAALSASIRRGWVYNASTPLFVTLPGILSPILVPLPHPFWVQNSPSHHMLSGPVRDLNALKGCPARCREGRRREGPHDTCLCDTTEEEESTNGVTATEFSMALLKHTVELSDTPMDLMVHTGYLTPPCLLSLIVTCILLSAPIGSTNIAFSIQ